MFDICYNLTFLWASQAVYRNLWKKIYLPLDYFVIFAQAAKKQQHFTSQYKWIFNEQGVLPLTQKSPICIIGDRNSSIPRKCLLLHISNEKICTILFSQIWKLLKIRSKFCPFFAIFAINKVYGLYLKTIFFTNE